MEGTCCRRDIRAAQVMLIITTVGRPDLVFDDDEGGHGPTAVLFLVTRRRDRDEAGVREMNYKNVTAKAGRSGRRVGGTLTDPLCIPNSRLGAKAGKKIG